AERQRIVDTYHGIYPGFSTVFVANRAGVVEQIFPTRDAQTPTVDDREYFTTAMKTRQMAMSDLIVGRLSKRPIVTIAVPILAATGEAAGIAGGSPRPAPFPPLLSHASTPT